MIERKFSLISVPLISENMAQIQEIAEDLFADPKKHSVLWFEDKKYRINLTLNGDSVVVENPQKEITTSKDTNRQTEDFHCLAVYVMEVIDGIKRAAGEIKIFNDLSDQMPNGFVTDPNRGLIHVEGQYVSVPCRVAAVKKNGRYVIHKTPEEEAEEDQRW